MKKLACLLICLCAVSANAALITDENFESGASGWSNNTTTTQGVLTTFLGRFGGTGGAPVINKNYALSGNQTQVTIEFDFYEIDSWDFELFKFFVDGNSIFSDEFKHNREDFANSPIMNATSLLFDGDNGNVDYGFATWPDQGYHYSYTFNTSSTNLLIGFGSTLNQSINDESWGIDNVRITDNANSTIPEPASLALLGLGLAGIGFSRKKKIT